MRKTLFYWIDTIVFSAMIFFTIKILTYLGVSFNYGYVIIGSLVLFVIGKMTLKEFVNKDQNN